MTSPWRVPLAVVLSAAALLAQARDERTAPVGMRARLDEVALPGSVLVPAPVDHKAPLRLRILATRPHGDHFRYDFEWTALEPGEHDLVRYLAREDGTPTEGLAPLTVRADSELPHSAREPSEPPPAALPRVAGYSTLQVVAGVLWGIGLLAILFVGRRFRRQRVVEAARPTLADRMRPLVAAVAGGAADDAARAELERLLVAFWRAKLGLREAKAAGAVAAICAPPEAGRLLRQVEDWLHRPEPPAPVDIAALLAPYRSVSAQDFDEVARVR